MKCWMITLKVFGVEEENEYVQVIADWVWWMKEIEWEGDREAAVTWKQMRRKEE